MQEKIMDLLLNQDELSWKKIIYELVESEQMDPWDINISLLAQKFIQIIRQAQEHDLKIPGNPPTPKQILQGILELMDRIKKQHCIL